MEKVNLIRREKFRESSNLGFERDLTACGFPWPQRNYTCSFCKKQFKSAQALGGHMNVHRRDRAKLRSVQSPSWDFANPNPNPNRNPPSSSSSSSPAASFLPYQYSFLTPSLASFSSSPTSSSVCKKEEKLQLDPLSLSDGVLKSLAAQEDKSRVLMSRGNTTVSLDLGMSLFRDAEEELDLELRLG